MFNLNLFQDFKLLTNDRNINILFVIGTAFFFLAFFISISSSILFWFNVSISSLTLIGGCLATAVYCIILSRILFSASVYKYSLVAIVIFLAIMLFSILIASYFYDVTWEGQKYHQYAIYHLAHGWNPFKAEIGYIYPDVYSKGPWLYAASICKFTGNIESGKAFNFAFILGSFCVIYVALVKIIKTNYALIISLIAALNPVSIYQSLGFYIDGQLSSLLLTIVSLLFMVTRSTSRVYKNLYLFVIFMAIILLVNVKFTGLVYSIVFSSLLALYLFVFCERYVFFQFVLTVFAAIVIGVSLVGYNPYITNTLNYQHPFYPIYGPNRDVHFMIGNEPIPYIDKNHLHKFFLSIFAKPGDYHPSSYSSDHLSFQIPFAFDRKMLSTYTYPDTRIGGFGPLWNVIVIMSTLLAWKILSSIKNNNKGFIFIIVLWLLSVLINPLCWWARIVPHFWFLPMFCAIFAINFSYKFTKVLAQSIILICLINILILIPIYVRYNITSTIEMNTKLFEFSELSSPVILLDVPTSISQSTWIGPQIRLAEKGIEYKIIDPQKSPCAQSEKFPFTTLPYCLE